MSLAETGELDREADAERRIRAAKKRLAEQRRELAAAKRRARALPDSPHREVMLAQCAAAEAMLAAFDEGDRRMRDAEHNPAKRAAAIEYNQQALALADEQNAVIADLASSVQEFGRVAREAEKSPQVADEWVDRLALRLCTLQLIRGDFRVLAGDRRTLVPRPAGRRRRRVKRSRGNRSIAGRDPPDPELPRPSRRAAR